MEYVARRLAQIPGVVAVTLGGSRATGMASHDSDWDFGLYYHGRLDPAHVAALGWHGRVFAPGDWGRIVNGGAWLEVDGVRVDVIYRDLDEVLFWTTEAREGRFEIQREVGYVAGIATYVLAGELAIGKPLVGELPRPSFPTRLQETAPPTWYHLAAGAVHFAEVYARRGDRVGCLANLTQAVLATAQGRLAAAADWALNEKRIVERSGLHGLQSLLAESHDDLVALTAETRHLLQLPDWT